MPEISPARFRAGRGEPVVLIHGFTLTWRCWIPVLAELVGRYDVLAPTLPGHEGGPPRPVPPDRSLVAAATRLEHELDAQGIGSAHLVGNSMGGALVLELARRGRARSVVALSPGAGWVHGDPEGERLERFFRRQLRAAALGQAYLTELMRRPWLRRAALRDVVAYGEQLPPDEAAAIARSSLRCTVFDDVWAAVRSGEALLRGLRAIRAPVLVAWAERDRVLPRSHHEPYFRARLPRAEFRLLRDVGHVPMSDDPALVAGTIVDWVERHRGAPAVPAAREERGREAEPALAAQEGPGS